MKFFLIRIPESYKKFDLFSSSQKVSSIYPPLGLEYIGASLEQDGNSVEIIDLGAENISRETLKDHLMKSDAVGMSVYINNYKIAANIAKEIKEIDPDIPLIIGGPHCTLLGRSVLNQIPNADISVESEGELVILDLVRFFQGTKKLSDICGINYRENNDIKSSKTLQVINDLDGLPFPARHLTEKYDYGNFDGGLLPRKKFTSMITGRGCPFKCRFCTRFGNIEGWRFRRRSPENIVKEMQEISEKYRSIMIVDDTFLADKKATHAIMDGLIELGLNLDIYILGARVDTAEPELYKKMKKAGVKYVAFGIESGNQDVLDFYNKKITLPQIKKAVRLARKMDFITQGFFIFGAPFETKKHIQNTIKLATSLPFDIVVFQPLGYEIGSDIWEEAVKDKKISKEDISVLADSRRGLGNFIPEELNIFVKNGYRRFYFNPMYISRLLFGTLLHRNTNHLKTIFRLVNSHYMNKLL
ncbi:MAG: radical SAM protein [Euryarchaeota archaeon]|nr:radical SAM protein [Euryarchaeota archaeon]